MVYKTGSGEVEINHWDYRDYIGDGGRITAPFIDASATGIVISVSKGVYKEFDQSFDNSYIYFSTTFYAILDKASKVILQPNHYVMPSCPRQWPTVNDVSDGVVKTSCNDVATDNPKRVSSWMRLFAEELFFTVSVIIIVLLVNISWNF